MACRGGALLAIVLMLGAPSVTATGFLLRVENSGTGGMDASVAAVDGANTTRDAFTIGAGSAVERGVPVPSGRFHLNVTLHPAGQSSPTASTSRDVDLASCQGTTVVIVRAQAATFPLRSVGVDGAATECHDDPSTPSRPPEAESPVTTDSSTAEPTLPAAGGGTQTRGTDGLLGVLGIPLALVAAGGAGAFVVHRRRARRLAASSPVASIAPGRMLRGKYALQRKLGEGAFGEVWLANHTQLQRRVVLKRLQGTWISDPESLGRFRREARLMAQVDHPRVARVFDVEDIGGELFLVMEYVEGESLADRLGRGPLSPRDAGVILADVLEGLAAIHGQGILHRDVKPGNILIDRKGRAKIADFGIARHIDARATSKLTASSASPGTPLYMAPEQLRGEREDIRTDLYAMAATAYEALAGHSYLGREVPSWSDLVRRIEHGHVAPVANAGPELNAWLRQGLAKHRDDRFADASSMARGLREALRGR